MIRGREMHWIRIDRYFEGDLDDAADLLPARALHALRERAVRAGLPGGATVHSAEGLNDMVYNRCVGTRYCSNNCPYKVRRFNFFLYADWMTESLKMHAQPGRHRAKPRRDGEVHLLRAAHQRSEDRGREARIDASRDGEIMTACQQVCPAEAIVFGDINDRKSRVAKLKALPRNYGMLAELNTRPRTTYLARVENPNPQLAKRAAPRSGSEEG